MDVSRDEVWGGRRASSLKDARQRIAERRRPRGDGDGRHRVRPSAADSVSMSTPHQVGPTMRPQQPPLIARLVQRVTDARWRVLLVGVLLVAATGSGARLLTMNADYKVFFSKANPQLAAFEALQRTYTKDDNILIAIEPADGAVFSRATLSAPQPPGARGCPGPSATGVEAIHTSQARRPTGDDRDGGPR